MTIVIYPTSLTLEDNLLSEKNFKKKNYLIRSTSKCCIAVEVMKDNTSL